MGFLPQREYDVAEFNMVKNYLTEKICAPRHNFAEIIAHPPWKILPEKFI